MTTHINYTTYRYITVYFIFLEVSKINTTINKYHNIIKYINIYLILSCMVDLSISNFNSNIKLCSAKSINLL
ncbi:hypothetical protein PFTANZ_04687 [Plasmodium falciparum Tanzania (2000708)]|uniref:Uncharacterized protein n=1 Tax=Plasmodium falciparum Tanzania (2000708) TaxID=1036725 RepID=A0A024W0X8_PLAFA|nr:hypothetical protein PFTANZ_04687 [Plasmodium falciparum Tanzania (2000708)]